MELQQLMGQLASKKVPIDFKSKFERAYRMQSGQLTQEDIDWIRDEEEKLVA